jgi:hypothetical protein
MTFPVGLLIMNILSKLTCWRRKRMENFHDVYGIYKRNPLTRPKPWSVCGAVFCFCFTGEGGSTSLERFCGTHVQPTAQILWRWSDSEGTGLHQLCKLGPAGIFPYAPARACWLGAARSSAHWELLALGLKCAMVGWQLRLLSTTTIWRSLEWPLGKTYVLLCPWLLPWPTHGLSWAADGAPLPRHQVDDYWRDAARHSKLATPALPVASKNGRAHHQHLAAPGAGERELTPPVLGSQHWPTTLIGHSNNQLGEEPLFTSGKFSFLF